MVTFSWDQKKRWLIGSVWLFGYSVTIWVSGDFASKVSILVLEMDFSRLLNHRKENLHISQNDISLDFLAKLKKQFNQASNYSESEFLISFPCSNSRIFVRPTRMQLFGYVWLFGVWLFGSTVYVENHRFFASIIIYYTVLDKSSSLASKAWNSYIQAVLFESFKSLKDSKTHLYEMF